MVILTGSLFVLQALEAENNNLNDFSTSVKMYLSPWYSNGFLHTVDYMGMREEHYTHAKAGTLEDMQHARNSRQQAQRQAAADRSRRTR